MAIRQDLSSRAMLLSTLAVMVILTHQEETLQGAETTAIVGKDAMVEVSDFDQPWGEVESSGAGLEDSWSSAKIQERGPRRRRPGRKRRRRPNEMKSEATENRHEIVEMKVLQQDDLPSIFENIERPKRRRKRPEALYYSLDEPMFERPANRRRGNRRRQRPYLPDLENTQKEFQVEVITEHEDNSTTTETPSEESDHAITKVKPHLEHDEVMDMILPNNDRSTSSDFLQTNPKYKINDRVKSDKSFRISYGVAKRMNTTSQTEHPSTYIKELLKKADGLSLSELLQRHNLTLTDLISGKTSAIDAIKHVTTTPEVKTNPGATKLLNSFHEQLSKVTSDISNESVASVEITSTSKPEVEQRKLQPLHQNKLNSSLEEQLMKESQQTGSNRRRLPPIQGRRNLRPRIKSHRNSTTVRSYIRRRPFYTTVEPTTEAEIDEITTIEETKQLETTTTEGSILEEIEHVDSENQIIQDNPTHLIIPAKRPKPKYISTNLDLRRRMQNKQSKKEQTAEIPENAIKISLGDMFGMTNLVSASQFITHTASPQLPSSDDEDGLADLFPDRSFDAESDENMIPKDKSQETTNNPQQALIINSDENKVDDIIKDELFDIFNDTAGSARLGRILKERRMSLKELVEQRERGSSNIHLADIFHNASKEPNPPEPFLAKSILEPMSRETYPLKALLDASIQEPNIKRSDTNGKDNNMDVLLNYGKNINENGDIFGIVSLFYGDNKNNDKQLTPISNSTDMPREGRAFVSPKTENVHEVFRSTYAPPANAEINEIVDIDGDGVIILEDLQKQQESAEIQFSSKFGKVPSSVRSVTIATTVVMGLSAIVFLMTYLACKWRINRRNRKHEMSVGRSTPTPVFENRKISKNNCSSRSISPMLTATTIYTVSGNECRNGKESPDYGWGNMRVPYQ